MSELVLDALLSQVTEVQNILLVAATDTLYAILKKAFATLTHLEASEQ